jgi:signal transduction histidine kinase/CheY-like chemotaxis protein
MKKNKSTILVVDDSLTQLAVLEDALGKEGFNVETAKNGVEAIVKVYQCLPCLILSDVMMPELNGYHLCRLLKNDPRTAHIPVILLTNLTERHDRFWGENAGADRYLEKGGDLTPIIEAVASLLPATPPKANHISRGVDSGDIRSRITDILDRLLYESTISNEVLKLTGLVHDIDLLAREFLKFLSNISRYSAAGLLLKDGRGKYLLSIQSSDPVSDTFIERAKKQILQQAGLSNHNHSHIRFMVPENGSDPREEAESAFHVLLSIPIVDQDEFLASVTIFDARERHLSYGTQHALKVAADRFLIVTRYLKKFKEIEDVKADFVSMLVHDMRSPLTSIRGFTDVLAEGILGSVTDEQRGAFKNIQSGCDQLLFLIEDILELSKLEAGKMQIHPFPLPILQLAERAVTDLSTQFKEKNLDVRMEIAKDLPLVMADGKQLIRVLTNLLINAVKFSPDGGKITLSANRPAVGPAGDLKDCLVVSVRDDGPGIPPEQQKKLFGRYQQLASARMFRKGTGLGLAICKEITGLHGGEIWVESPLGESGGSRFSFTLPVA